MELTGKEIRKSYGKKEVLCGIDLTLEEHKIYGLIGRNGAGKTTLRLPCRSEGYDVSQTPGRQAIFQPVRR